MAFVVAWLAWELWPPPLVTVPHWPALVGVTVINPGRDRIPNQTIVLRGDRIEAIREQRPEDRRELRLGFFENRYVLPGLVDLRVHQPPSFTRLSPFFGLLYLAAGVTTVRDTGNFAGDLAATQQAIRDGTMAWPRLIACGRVLEADPPSCRASRGVRDRDDAIVAIVELARAGAQCARIHRSVPAGVRDALEAAATARGLPVVGDAPTRTQRAEAALLDAIVVNEAAPELATLLARWHMLAPGALDALTQQLAPGAYVPALVPWHRLASSGDPNFSALDPSAVFLPRAFRAVIWPAQARRAVPRPPPGTRAGIDAALVADVMMKMAHVSGRLRARGARLRVATGAPSLYVSPGNSMWFEFLLLTASGLTPTEMWQAATRDAGEALGIAQLGAVEPGAPADLLVFREDPTATSPAQAWSTLEAVVSQGRLYPRELLLRAMLEQARYFERPLYDRLSTTLARLMLWWDADAVVDCQLL